MYSCRVGSCFVNEASMRSGPTPPTPATVSHSMSAVSAANTLMISVR
jgi:hypothetical protein